MEYQNEMMASEHLPPRKHKNLSTAPVEALEKGIKTLGERPVKSFTSQLPTIKFKAFHPDFKFPVKAKEGDACYDLVATSMEVKDGYIHYGLGCALEIPEGWQALIFPRSSISNTDLVLTNSVGVIDSGYRGEIGARFKLTYPVLNSLVGGLCQNRMAGDPRVYQVGDRVCQIQFLPLPQYTLELVEELSESERGSGGFGSTNK